MHPHTHSRDHRRRLGQLLPWCLDFGVSTAYESNHGHGATIDDLHTAGFTADLLWYYTPAPGTNYYHTLFGQGVWTAAGWRLAFYNGTHRLFFEVRDGANASKATSILPLATETWYYIRARRSGNTIYVSVNAGSETPNATLAAGGTASADDITIGKNHGSYRALGRVAYAHLWNTDKGALSAVPTGPLAVDANTVLRCTFTDGGGATLTDSSGNANNGTITGATWARLAPATWTP